MTFGEHLRQFALSIDFIDGMQYSLVQQHIKEYLRLQLGAQQVGFFERTKVDDQDGMTTVWSYPTLRVYQSLKDAQGKYRRQLGLALGEERSLWVVSTNGERLSGTHPGRDHWLERQPVRDLPPFCVAQPSAQTRTAIYMSTRDACNRPNGVLLVEIGNAVRPTQALRTEMQLLSDAVGLLHASDAGTREQREGTSQAIARLGDLVRQLELDTGPRPLLFFASSHRASPEVLKAIHEVLAGFEDRVFVQLWGDMHHPGNINAQLVGKIRSAQYGICYLSEPNDQAPYQDEAAPRYRDNPNVLIEAGMLHIVTNSGTQAATGWIPIREKDSPAMPFDLANERHVVVERDDAGNLLDQKFRDDLRNKLQSLLMIDGDEEAMAGGG